MNDDYDAADPADYPALCCQECAGTGEMVGDDDEDYTCPACDGTGWPPESG